MRISTLRITNYRCFEDTGTLQASQINLIIGRNNSGKSSLLKAIHSLQVGGEVRPEDLRFGADEGKIYIGGVRIPNPPPSESVAPLNCDRIDITIGGSQMHFEAAEVTKGNQWIWNPFPDSEPQATIYPLFRRNPSHYQNQINIDMATRVISDWQNLPARIDRLTEAQSPNGQRYFQMVNEIVGTQVGAITTRDGKSLGQVIDTNRRVYIDRMGDGVSLILPIASAIQGVSDKIFLIEEPENGLHPAALKVLLKHIELASQQNQFFITTHSNVVLRYLGGTNDATIWKVSEDSSQTTPTSLVEPISSDPRSRLDILRDLGYELSDFDLFSAWLFLEESSAERLIRDLFVRWFAPKLLGRIRTVAARGVDEVESRFSSFNHLFVFCHLEPQYRQRAWVLTDGDTKGSEIVKRLRETYQATWPESHFRTLSVTDLELLFPQQFQVRAQEALALGHEEKPAAKVALLNEVLAWAEQNDELAKSEFATSAREICELLREIESSLYPDDGDGTSTAP